ncbi:hypothetical protein [Endozoicomonas sp. 4G]|uniref:hypothetical protein n=1 Tax=Endozoicomonas sp. 4G TaxID=2872754 RepID=UPI002078EAF1|nr:hypothetical protein [Endozoicomonas sp. 4G]
MSDIRAAVINELVEFFPAHIKGVFTMQTANVDFPTFCESQCDIPMITDANIDSSFLSDTQLGPSACGNRNRSMLVGS